MLDQSLLGHVWVDATTDLECEGHFHRHKSQICNALYYSATTHST